MRRLTQLEPGEQAEISALECTGQTVLRLSQLGMIPGAKVRLLFKSIFSDPAAYFINGAVIALRKKDCSKIYVSGGEHDFESKR